jgi:hypothetical protein
MIMQHAIASSQEVEPVKNGTTLTRTKATLRAQAYSAMLRTSIAVWKVAAIENPRLITALTAVISAQKINGMLILKYLRCETPRKALLSPAQLLGRLDFDMDRFSRADPHEAS